MAQLNTTVWQYLRHNVVFLRCMEKFSFWKKKKGGGGGG